MGMGISGGYVASPVGSVVFMAKAVPPSGWLVCNGAAISRTLYPGLFNAIGTTYGAGDGASTFNLPDLRDDFIRGASASRAVGNREADAFQGHEHEFYDVQSGGGGGYMGSGANNWTRNTQNIVTKGGYSAPRVADETRPRNVAMLPCIKF